MAPRNKDGRSAAQKAEHQKQIAELYLRQGKTQMEIAEKLSISQPTVSRDLAELRKQWAREANRTVAHAQAEKLEELKRVKAAAWQGWDRSQTTVLTTKGEILVEQELPGDSRFLEQIQKAILAEIDLFGLKESAGMKIPLELVLMAEHLGVDVKSMIQKLTDSLKRQALKEP